MEELACIFFLPLTYNFLMCLSRYFVDVLRNNQLTDDCQEVQLFVDGSWKCYVEEGSTEAEQKNSKNETTNSPTASPHHAVRFLCCCIEL